MSVCGDVIEFFFCVAGGARRLDHIFDSKSRSGSQNGFGNLRRHNCQSPFT